MINRLDRRHNTILGLDCEPTGKVAVQAESQGTLNHVAVVLQKPSDVNALVICEKRSSGYI